LAGCGSRWSWPWPAHPLRPRTPEARRCRRQPGEAPGRRSRGRPAALAEGRRCWRCNRCSGRPRPAARSACPGEKIAAGARPTAAGMRRRPAIKAIDAWTTARDRAGGGVDTRAQPRHLVPQFSATRRTAAAPSDSRHPRRGPVPAPGRRCVRPRRGSPPAPPPRTPSRAALPPPCCPRRRRW
jgi:hypothetical protein